MSVLIILLLFYGPTFMTRRVAVLVSFFAMMALLAGCGAKPAPDQNVSAANPFLTPDSGVQVDERGVVEVASLDDSRVPEVEEMSGLELPSDARIFTVVDSKSSYRFSFYTAQSLDELKIYWQDELSAKGYSLKRAWTAYAIQNYSSATGLFSKSGATISISIEDQNGQRLVNVTQD